ncbi:ABC-2 family transporter [Motilibacter peucedani]|uniref:ABC-2 family transporter n=1 Tax=Motilibacter peucedani TaxID=598650 RepID=A0A420XTH0_9ACTN|nr:ABC transporter permease [Motilibacter peucedani]RKS80057.1 ABC-2 family transporter [Motilibacter peucedani]
MSTTTAPTRPAHTPGVSAGAGIVTFPRVVASEWVKFRTLRSSWLTLLGAVLAPILIAIPIGYNTGKNWGGLAPEDQAPSGVLQGYFLAQLLIGVLGVLFVSGEYSTGMIRSTLAAVPKRVPVLVAKAIVFGALSAVALTAASVLAFLVGNVYLHADGHGYSLTDATVPRVVVGTGIYLALVGLLGGALGWIVRSTPGGISALVAIVIVIPTVFEILPGTWAKDVGQVLPSSAGGSFVSSVHAAHTLPPWTGLGVMALWVVGSLGVAAVLLKRRDG